MRGRADPFRRRLQADRPRDEQRRADAAFVTEVLVEVERRIAEVRPGGAVGRMRAGLTHARQGLADMQIRPTRAGTSVETERAPLVARAVVGGEHDQGVREFAVPLEVGEQSADALVDVLDHRGESGHAAREIFAQYGYRELRLPLLERTGLATFFEQTVSGDSLARKKPDPMQLLHVCGQFGIAPARMLMVGDSGNDALAARAAGCPVFCVPYGYNEGHDVQSLDVDAIVGALTDCIPLIRKP